MSKSKLFFTNVAQPSPSGGPYITCFRAPSTLAHPTGWPPHLHVVASDHKTPCYTFLFSSHSSYFFISQQPWAHYLGECMFIIPPLPHSLPTDTMDTHTFPFPSHQNIFWFNQALSGIFVSIAALTFSQTSALSQIDYLASCRSEVKVSLVGLSQGVSWVRSPEDLASSCLSAVPEVLPMWGPLLPSPGKLGASLLGLLWH